MQCALLPDLIWKDAGDSVHQPSAFLSFSLLPFFPTAIPLFLFKTLFPVPTLVIYSYSLSHIIQYNSLSNNLSFSLPSLFHSSLLCLPICQENISPGLFLSSLLSPLECVCACMCATLQGPNGSKPGLYIWRTLCALATSSLCSGLFCLGLITLLCTDTQPHRHIDTDEGK